MKKSYEIYLIILILRIVVCTLQFYLLLYYYLFIFIIAKEWVSYCVGHINYSEFVGACLACKEGIRREYAELIFSLYEMNIYELFYFIFFIYFSYFSYFIIFLK